ncbi:hypothetical protein AGMMS50262_03610 [Bacteroidia bacterium]|nr:hypothetical protein AGMMS50262_03610 [Bacteroidia bacterium]
MRKFTLLTLLLGIFSAFPLSAKIWINELMQSNIDLVRDDLQEFPDSWVELYNDSDQAVDIQNWYVSDKPDYRTGWKINTPAVIETKGYLLIYADTEAKGLHTSFRLESGSGGAFYLFDKDGILIDEIPYIPKQLAPNIAWGRISDGNDTWAYFVSATPYSPNTGKISDRLLPLPIFSRAGGIISNSVDLELSLPSDVPAEVALSDIHYTLDNSEPTIDSPAYSESLTISQTTIVRAKIIHPDYLSGRSQVQSYIFSSKDFSLPVISISTDSTYLWDEEFGIYCKGNGKYGVAGRCVEYPVNWNNDWRRPANFEYFPLESDTSILNQLGEMRISGGCSRSNSQKTFIVYGNKRFGVKRFEYDFFKDKPNQEIKSFMIRNSGNDFWFTHFRDAAIQLFMGQKVDIDYQAYQPAIFYLNGNYWGIQNLRERSNEDFVLANYGREDIDMIENWGGELKTGDLTAWNQLMKELRKSSSSRNYEWIKSQVDVNEFINYMILEIYVSNTDFPGNNMVMWRPREDNGKWRFILKDMDFGLGIWGTNPVTHNALKYNTENNNDDRKLFNALLTQNDFKKEFYSRFAIYMGDLLHYKTTSLLIDSIQKLIEPSMQTHLDRWRPEMWYQDMDGWRREVSSMKTWCFGRNYEVYKHLQDYFKLGTIMKLTLETADNLNETPVISVNGVRLQKPALNGSYFQKETLQLHYDGNAPLYAWEITETIDGTKTVKTYNQQDLSYPIVEDCTTLKIRLINKLNSIMELASAEIGLSAFDRQLQISNLQSPTLISIYDISGKLIGQTTTSRQSIVIPLHQKGIFIVKVQNEGQELTKKVVL